MSLEILACSRRSSPTAQRFPPGPRPRAPAPFTRTRHPFRHRYRYRHRNRGRNRYRYRNRYRKGRAQNNLFGATRPVVSASPALFTRTRTRRVLSRGPWRRFSVHVHVLRGSCNVTRAASTVAVCLESLHVTRSDVPPPAASHVPRSTPHAPRPRKRERERERSHVSHTGCMTDYTNVRSGMIPLHRIPPRYAGQFLTTIQGSGLAIRQVLSGDDFRSDSPIGGADRIRDSFVPPIGERHAWTRP